MSPRLDDEDPDRLYTVTGGRSRVDAGAVDLVTLIVSESEPSTGMQSEHVRILTLCRRPTAVVEISADLGMPVSVVKILLCDLLDTGAVTARHPSVTRVSSSPGVHPSLPDPELLKQVLVGLQNL
ncbi:DUF742 domain-containing protein [Umezawaea beigongshangensis]|uniref:DUF742 domain-containing protein n=1 Tax=Umezawaea beigongshangensis TaxID=2780383 RepID=UPI0018F12DD0|nr:DUF742 domain-containing protein [Umezawaea beigongshangensis]